jgi:hypothetical protein
MSDDREALFRQKSRRNIQAAFTQGYRFSTIPDASKLSLDFLVKGAALQAGVIFQLFDLLLHGLFIARGHVTRRIFALFASFGALNDNCFSGHGFIRLKVLRGKGGTITCGQSNRKIHECVHAT